MEFSLNIEEQQLLLAAAREVIAARLERRQPETAAPEPGSVLLEPCGAFVTLHQDTGSLRVLRGCIGHIVGRQPLFETVKKMAIAAAFEDPRFPPMNPRDWSRTDIEISVLSPLRQIGDPREIEVGKHGIYITRGHRSGVLLPQVAGEQGWDRDTFLVQTCRKAGLPADAWQDRDTIIEIFSAQIFSEKPSGDL